MTTDLTARVAELAAIIEARLADDEAAAGTAGGGAWEYRDSWVWADPCEVADIFNIPDTDAAGAFIARNDPARVLRRVRATRDLVAAILAEGHQYVDSDPWFSCSQATVPGEEEEPGSACADDERRGKPCDCGRDIRVARLLGIIASEWEE